jgi:hypothetical protein
MHRITLMDAAMPDDPVALWHEGPDVARLASTWLAVEGARVPVDESLLAALGTTMGFPTDILRTYTSPTPGDWLHTDGASRSVDGWIETTTTDGRDPFSDRDLPSAAGGLAWLAYHLSAGDPIRDNLGVVYALIRQRLRNPDLMIGTVQLRPEQVPPDLGPALGAGQPMPGGKVCYHLRPAWITNPHDPVLDVFPDHSPISIRLMLDPAFGRMIANLSTDGLPAGAYAQNALLTAPDLAAGIADELQLEPAAASLYLQLLTLPDPTDDNMLRWNAWTPADLAHHGAALVHRKLVIEASRPGAGRRLFLRGPWLVRKFVPAFEAWKAPLYGFCEDQEPPYRWHVVSRPLGELFEAAAERIRSGDVPL